MTHTVEHEGTTATFREPMGREAVQFVREFSRVPQAPLIEGEPTEEQVRQNEEMLYGLSDLIHDWMPRLVVEPSECKDDPAACWTLYKLLGRSTGPLAELFSTLIGESLMIPPEQIEELPFRRGEGDGGAAPVGDADAG